MRNSLNLRSQLALATMMLAALMFGAASTDLAAQEYSSKGADSCLMCHKSSKWEITDMFATKHGSQTDPDAPFSNEQCESCHGPSNEHARAKKKSEVLPYRTFGKNSPTPVTEQNQACLTCHRGHDSGWFGSAHENADVSCVSCHDVHAQKDPIMDPVEQQEVCFSCHPRTRSDSYKASAHPLRFGNMSCSSCHNVHEGNHDYLLTSDNVNDTCYECHAEKRGPVLFEHAPVTEDCGLCHEPHGSNHPALLTKRPPLLCQQCHSATDHPGQGYTGDDIGMTPANRFLQGKSCMNCHDQVHGSNHPSGSSQMR